MTGNSGFCSNFTGFCSYPLGGYSTAALLLMSCFALSLTVYSVSGCTFLSITFDSDTGSFEEYFVVNDVPKEVATYRASVGLFTWMRPLSSSNTVDTADASWKEDGACVGYQQTMMTALSNDNFFFEMARMFGILSVLGSIFMVSWSFLTACMLWNRVQLFLLSALNFIVAIACGMTFLMFQSNLCNPESPSGVFLNRKCTLDNGALVMIGSCMMWFVSFLISVVFLSPTDEFKQERQQHRSLVVSSNNRGQYSSASAKDGLQQSLARNSTIQQQQQQQQQQAKKLVDTSKVSQSPSWLSKPSFNKKNNNDRIISSSINNKGKVVSPETILQRNSYSFDSQDNWNNPIPSRSSAYHQQNQQQQAVSSIEEGRSHALPFRTKPKNDVPSTSNNNAAATTRSTSLPVGTAIQTIKPRRTPSRMIIDDVSDKDTMEVYIQQKLDRIEKLTVAEI